MTDGVKFYDQQILAHPSRDDGHDEAGRAGDCLRAAAATVMQVDPSVLSHYAEHKEWWPLMQQEALTRGCEWAFVEIANWDTWTVPGDRLVITSGPSPRGSFLHSVVATAADLAMVHDPHPSRAGVLEVEDVFVLLLPSDLAAMRYAEDES